MRPDPGRWLFVVWQSPLPWQYPWWTLWKLQFSLPWPFFPIPQIAGGFSLFIQFWRHQCSLILPWHPLRDHLGPPLCFLHYLHRLCLGPATPHSSLSSEKRLKYTDSVQEWSLCSRHVLSDIQKLYGRLLHASLVIPAGRAYLTGHEEMLALTNQHPFIPYLPVKGISHDLARWVLKLASPPSRPIPAPIDPINLNAFSDASAGFGIAITIQGRWRAWHLILGWQTLEGSCDIGWAEAIGFEFLIRTIAQFTSPSGCFKVFSDNQGVVKGWRNSRSGSKPTNCVIWHIHSFLEQFDYSFSILAAYVPSQSNPANPLPEQSSLLSSSCQCPPLLPYRNLWRPTFLHSPDSPSLDITDSDLDHLITIINTSWQHTTWETYGAGLLVFHIFCNLQAIPETERCPADPLLMLTFISACAGSYSGKTLANYFYAICTWHTLHGAPWHMNAGEMKAALDGASILAPLVSKKPMQAPMTVNTITS